MAMEGYGLSLVGKVPRSWFSSDMVDGSFRAFQLSGVNRPRTGWDRTLAC
jgi:hypothetical protein